MRKTSVLLVADPSLLSDSLEILLTQNGRLYLYRAVAFDYRKLLSKIYQYGPVVLLVEKEAFAGNVAELVGLLHDYGRLQIIVISSASNDIQIYASYQIAMTGLDDLMTLIHNAQSTPTLPRQVTAVFPSSSFSTILR